MEQHTYITCRNFDRPRPRKLSTKQNRPRKICSFIRTGLWYWSCCQESLWPEEFKWVPLHYVRVSCYEACMQRLFHTYDNHSRNDWAKEPHLQLWATLISSISSYCFTRKKAKTSFESMHLTPLNSPPAWTEIFILPFVGHSRMQAAHLDWFNKSDEVRSKQGVKWATEVLKQSCRVSFLKTC